MTAFRIDLDGDPVEPDTDATGWWRDGETLTVRGEHGISTYRLPKRKPRVSIQRLGKGRSRLILGAFTTVTVTVDGPSSEIERLRDEVL